MNRPLLLSRYLFIFLTASIFFSNFVPITAKSLVFERRQTSKPQLSYFLYPIVGNIPGIQSFYGIGATASGIASTGTDLTAILLQGSANENFAKEGNNNNNFQLQILTVTDLPILQPIISNPALNDLATISLFYGNITNVAFPQRAERGIDSQKDDFNYILLNRAQFTGLELAFHFFEDQLELYYTKTGGSAEPLGFFNNKTKKFTSAEDAKVQDRGDGGRWGIYLDDTDSRRDPRIGYRFQYERYDYPSTRGEAPAYYQEDYNLTGFIPIFDGDRGILVINQFFSSSAVTQAGTVVDGEGICRRDDKDNLINKDLCSIAKRESKLGNATSLGGTLRLRGYPSNRFFDSYTNFQGLELRWYALETEKAFDLVIEKGVYTSMQLAFFYEQGTVAGKISELWENFKNSYGVGARFIFQSLILRADLGFSDEGREIVVFVGYPF